MEKKAGLKEDAMNYIVNYDGLTDHGYQKERKVALDCLNVALDAASTYQGTKRIVRRDTENLYVGEKCIPFAEIGHIYIVGAGKGTFPIVKALDEILGNRISKGVVALKEEAEGLSNPTVELIHASHPVPDEKSLEAGRKIAALAGQLTEKDVVFACITGGCSSLMVLPPEEIPFEDIVELGKELMKCGAPISEMNAVRKHTCRLKGGGLLNMLKKAQVITLTQDTRPENLPWPDPMLADPSTFADAIRMLKKYEMWDLVSEHIRRYLLTGQSRPEMETLKSVEGIQHKIYDVGNQRSACEAAQAYAERLGYHPMILSTKIEGEAREAGCVFAGIAKEISLYNRPVAVPCVVISAGETRVTIKGSCGNGGPNQEFVSGFAENIRGYASIVCASIDSEGTDGPTAIAGGITDEMTILTAEKGGIDIFEELREHNSSYVLTSTGDAIYTVPTGTNVVNLRVMVIGERKDGAD